MPSYSGVFTLQAQMQAIAAGTWTGIPLTASYLVIAGGGGGGGGGSGGAGGSGIVIISYPVSFPDFASIGGGLTYDQPSRSGYRVYRFTAGTGTVTV